MTHSLQSLGGGVKPNCDEEKRLPIPYEYKLHYGRDREPVALSVIAHGSMAVGKKRNHES